MTDITPIERLASNLDDAQSLAYETYKDLGKLLRAIEKFSDDKHIKTISRLGWGLADDWGNMTDCNLGDAKRLAEEIQTSVERES